MQIRSIAMIIAWGAGFFVFAAQAGTEQEAFVELSEAQMLRVMDTTQAQRTLKNVVRVEAGTILGINVVALNAALEQQRVNPNEVNFTYVTSTGQSQVSKSGFVCGVRLVDVPDEDQRENTEIMTGRDYCVSLVVVEKKSAVMEGNQSEIKAALIEVQQEQKPVLLADLSEDIIQSSNPNSDNLLIQTARGVLNPLVEFVAGNGSEFVKPLDTALNARSEFGMRKHPVLRKKRLHKGIDLRAALGSNVRSVLPGRILANRVERHRKGKRKGQMKGYGRYVIVVHPNQDMQTLYAHLSEFKSQDGERVSAGERIALSGASGIGTGPHLHFETHVGTTPTNPRKFIGHLIGQIQKMFEEFFLIG